MKSKIKGIYFFILGILVTGIDINIATKISYGFRFGVNEGVKKGFGDADFPAQDVNAAVNQPPIHNALNRGGHQGLFHMFPLLIGICLSCHKRSPAQIKYKIKK